MRGVPKALVYACLLPLAILTSCGVRPAPRIIVPPSAFGVFEVNLKKLPGGTLSRLRTPAVENIFNDELATLKNVGVNLNELESVEGFLLPGTGTRKDLFDTLTRLTVSGFDRSEFNRYTRDAKALKPTAYKTLTYYSSATDDTSVFSPSDTEIDIASSPEAMDQYLEANLLRDQNTTSSNARMEELLANNRTRLLFVASDIPTSLTGKTPVARQLYFASLSGDLSTSVKIELKLRSRDPSVAEGLAAFLDGVNKLTYGGLQLWPELQQNQTAAEILPSTVADAMRSASNLLRSLKSSVSGDSTVVTFEATLPEIEKGAAGFPVIWNYLDKK